MGMVTSLQNCRPVRYRGSLCRKSLTILVAAINFAFSIATYYEPSSSHSALTTLINLSQRYNVWTTSRLEESISQESGVPPMCAKAAVYRRYNSHTRHGELDKLPRVLVFGGLSKGGTWSYTPADNTWFSLPLKQQPPPRLGHTMTSFCDSYVLLFGGVHMAGVEQYLYSQSEGKEMLIVMNDGWIFDGVNEKWNLMARSEKYPSPRGSHTAVALNTPASNSSCLCQQSVFIYGGYRYSNPHTYNDLRQLSCTEQTDRKMFLKWSEIDRQSVWPFPAGGHLGAEISSDKSVMIIWPVPNPGKIRKDNYWIYNASSRNWHSFTVERDINRGVTELYNTAVFHRKLGQIIELRDNRAYLFSIVKRQWKLLSTTAKNSVVSKGTTVTAVYDDSLSVVVFDEFQLKADYNRPIVWTLNLEGLRTVWKLNTLAMEPTCPMVLGTWSKVGNFVILNPRRAPDLEIFLDNIYANFFKKMRRSLLDTLDGSTEELTSTIEVKLLMTQSYFLSLQCGQIPIHTDKLAREKNTVWHLSMKTLLWQPYSTSQRSSTANHFYSLSANWDDKAFITFGILSVSNPQSGGHFMSSDVMVYFVDNRRWINVTVLTAERPEFLFYPSLTYYKGSSFLLYGGGSLTFTQHPVEEFINELHQDCEQLPCDNGTDSLSNVITPKGDLWLLTLTNCNSSTCFDAGIVGTWTKIKQATANSEMLAGGCVGHSAVYADGKLFVFGGFGVLNADNRNQVIFRRQFAYFDLGRLEWSVVPGPGQRLDTILFPGLEYQKGIFKACAMGKRIVTSIPMLITEDNDTVARFRLVSLSVDTKTWIDHQIHLPFEGEAMFCWGHRLLLPQHFQETYFLETDRRKYITTVLAAENRLGCPAEHSSPNFPLKMCVPCPIGQYSSVGATNCTSCPGGLVTEELGAVSISNCTCDRAYCRYGRCFVARNENSLAAECVCQFGYSGERCEFPTLLISVITGLALLVLILIISISLRKVVTYRKAQQKREYELEEMNRAWTINCDEVFLLKSVDSTSPGSYGDVFKAHYRDMHGRGCEETESCNEKRSDRKRI